jgi:nitrogen fixation NifU-like protein
VPRLLLDHYRTRGTPRLPERQGLSAKPPLCRDEILALLIETTGRRALRGRLRDLGVASILTEEIKGKTLDEVKAIDREHVLENLGITISPARVKCALLGLKTLKGAAWGLQEWPGEDPAKAAAGEGTE